jgi:hypothetical protein
LAEGEAAFVIVGHVPWDVCFWLPSG